MLLVLRVNHTRLIVSFLIHTSLALTTRNILNTVSMAVINALGVQAGFERTEKHFQKTLTGKTLSEKPKTIRYAPVAGRTSEVMTDSLPVST